MNTLTTTEAATYLRISPWTLRRMAGAGEIRGSFYAGAWHFDQVDLDDYKASASNRAPLTPRRRSHRRAS